ncbi:MAG: hypothetical protein GXP29_06025 [Planctomycetes bacterium]|nr:hypothetical protein [Planctomycetota bacterium]
MVYLATKSIRMQKVCFQYREKRTWVHTVAAQCKKNCAQLLLLIAKRIAIHKWVSFRASVRLMTCAWHHKCFARVDVVIDALSERGLRNRFSGVHAPKLFSKFHKKILTRVSAQLPFPT